MTSKPPARNLLQAPQDRYRSLCKSAGMETPTELFYQRCVSVLLERSLSGQRDHVVLGAGTAAHADGTDHLAVDQQRIAAA